MLLLLCYFSFRCFQYDDKRMKRKKNLPKSPLFPTLPKKKKKKYQRITSANPLKDNTDFMKRQTFNDKTCRNHSSLLLINVPRNCLHPYSCDDAFYYRLSTGTNLKNKPSMVSWVTSCYFELEINASALLLQQAFAT